MGKALKAFIQQGGWIGPALQFGLMVVIGYILLVAAKANEATFVRKDSYAAHVEVIERRMVQAELRDEKLTDALNVLSGQLSRLMGYLDRQQDTKSTTSSGKERN